MNSFEVELLLGIVAIALIYQLPTIIAFARGHPNRWLILVVTTCLGATVVIWALCLLWSLNALHRSARTRNGGASGLNLLLDDKSMVPIALPTPQARERLDRLLAQGSIGREQYDRIVATL